MAQSFLFYSASATNCRINVGGTVVTPDDIGSLTGTPGEKGYIVPAGKRLVLRVQNDQGWAVNENSSGGNLNVSKNNSSGSRTIVVPAGAVVRSAQGTQASGFLEDEA